MTVQAFDLGDIFHFLVDNDSISIRCKRVVTTTFLAFLTPRISLVVLVFLISPALVGKKLLHLATRYFSGRVFVDLVFPESFSSFFGGLFS